MKTYGRALGERTERYGFDKPLAKVNIMETSKATMIVVTQTKASKH